MTDGHWHHMNNLTIIDQISLCLRQLDTRVVCWKLALRTSMELVGIHNYQICSFRKVIYNYMAKCFTQKIYNHAKTIIYTQHLQLFNKNSNKTNTLMQQQLFIQNIYTYTTSSIYTKHLQLCKVNTEHLQLYNNNCWHKIYIHIQQLLFTLNICTCATTTI